jgi:mannose-6-phosphate isomerase
VSQLSPFRTVPRYLDKAWGSGRRLRQRLGLEAPDGTGEVWLVSDLGGQESVIRDGPWAGQSLGELRRAEPQALLGPLAAEGFPLLIKFLEADAPLSVQLHPDGVAASSLGDGPHGKSEAWLVLEADADAAVWVGLEAPLTPDEVVRLARDGELLERLQVFRPEPWEAIEIVPGTLHTARGVLILEVMEPADVTYRVYDWGRDRPLHLDQAKAVLTRLQPARFQRAPAPTDRSRRSLAPRCPFQFEDLHLDAGQEVALTGPGPAVVVVLEGGLEIAGIHASPGDAIVAPAAWAGAGVASESARVGLATVSVR